MLLIPFLVILIHFFHLHLGTLLIANALWGKYNNTVRSKTLAIVMMFSLLLCMFFTFQITDTYHNLIVQSLFALAWIIPYSIAWRVMLRDNEHKTRTTKLLQVLAGSIFALTSSAVILFTILMIIIWR